MEELKSILISDAKFLNKMNQKKSLSEPIEKIRKLCSR